jgi:hypothetical protein
MAFCSGSEIPQSRPNESIHRPDAWIPRSSVQCSVLESALGGVGGGTVIWAQRKEQAESRVVAGSIEEDIECELDMWRRDNQQARLQRFLSGFPGSGVGNGARCISVTMPMLMLDQTALSQDVLEMYVFLRRTHSLPERQYIYLAPPRAGNLQFDRRSKHDFKATANAEEAIDCRVATRYPCKVSDPENFYNTATQSHRSCAAYSID